MLVIQTLERTTTVSMGVGPEGSLPLRPPEMPTGPLRAMRGSSLLVPGVCWPAAAVGPLAAFCTSPMSPCASVPRVSCPLQLVTLRTSGPSAVPRLSGRRPHLFDLPDEPESTAAWRANLPVLGCHLAPSPEHYGIPSVFLGIAGCLPTPDPATCSRNPLRCSFLAERMP